MGVRVHCAARGRSCSWASGGAGSVVPMDEWLHAAVLVLSDCRSSGFLLGWRHGCRMGRRKARINMKKSTHYKAKRIWDGITTVFVVLTVAAAALMLGGRLFGLQNYVVLSGSMVPTYPVGALVYVQPVDDPATLRVGDPITFRVDEETMVTHRIVGVEGSGSSLRFETKGDANEQPDAGMRAASDVVGKVVFSVPLFGQLSSFLQTTTGRAVAVGYAAFLLLMFILPEVIFYKGGAKVGKHQRL